MSDEQIKNALTAEEWAEPSSEYGQRLWWLEAGGLVDIRSDGRFLVNWDGAASDSAGQDLSVRDRHKVAALCLYGQSFGFSQEDVQQLRVLLEKTEMLDDRGPEGEGWQSDELQGARAQCTSLLARIAALLPPEETR